MGENSGMPMEEQNSYGGSGRQDRSRSAVASLDAVQRAQGVCLEFHRESWEREDEDDLLLGNMGLV